MKCFQFIEKRSAPYTPHHNSPTHLVAIVEFCIEKPFETFNQIKKSRIGTIIIDCNVYSIQ